MDAVDAAGYSQLLGSLANVATFTEDDVLLFGRESVGFPAALRDRYRDRLVRLPMHDPALRSLNVSTCVGIVVYEVLRQWRAAPHRP